MPLSLVKNVPTGFRHEDNLLLQCARTYIDAEDTKRIRILLQGQINWTYVIQTALRHGVMPLLYQNYRNFSRLYPEAVSTTILDQLQTHVHATARHNLLTTGELFKLLNLLKQHEIPVIPYKGPVLAASIYGRLALRQFVDLDLLVHERDYLRAQNLLIAKGYQLIREYSWESTLVDAGGKIYVDLHQGITPRAFPLPLDFERLWQRLESVVIAGTAIPSFSLGDMFIILCIQLAKDRWENRTLLVKICDIAELLRVHQGMDWRWVLEETARLRCQRMLLFSLGLTSDLLGTTLPQEIRQKIQADSSVSLFVAHARQQLFHGTEKNHLDLLKRIRFHFAMQERWRDKLAQLRMVQVKLSEWRSATRPPQPLP